MSGRKRTLFKTPLLSAGDASQASLTSSVLPLDGLDNMLLQVNVNSGSPSGTLAVQVSADYQQDYEGNVLSAGTWGTILSQTLTSGSPSPWQVDLNQMGSLYLKVVYTRTSGTGSLSIYAVGKEI